MLSRGDLLGWLVGREGDRDVGQRGSVEIGLVGGAYGQRPPVELSEVAGVGVGLSGGGDCLDHELLGSESGRLMHL